ncbi:hypothetical protein ACFQ4Z_02615 [Oceanobacillus oncorhynchi subsp. oncorhynchi]|uniref:hypothetical protein n=1 Tax=Oceanobacillus oncorhynchi TaxID=545501 RepID=UPI00363037BA
MTDIIARFEIEKQCYIDCHLRGISAIHRGDYQEMDLCLKDARNSLIAMQNLEIEYKLHKEIKDLAQGATTGIVLQNIVDSIEQNHQQFMRSRI